LFGLCAVPSAPTFLFTNDCAACGRPKYPIDAVQCDIPYAAIPLLQYNRKDDLIRWPMSDPMLFCSQADRHSAFEIRPHFGIVNPLYKAIRIKHCINRAQIDTLSHQKWHLKLWHGSPFKERSCEATCPQASSAIQKNSATACRESLEKYTCSTLGL